MHQVTLRFLCVSILALAIHGGCSNTSTTPNLTSAKAPSAGPTAPADPVAAPAAAGPVKVGKFTPTMLDTGEASHITVQHVLIAFQGTGTGATRTKAEAYVLAKEVFEKAQAGEDFGQLVVAHTDDSPPGIYNMANFGQEEDMSPMTADADKVFPRGGMVGAFGNTGFPLAVGEIGMAEFDEKNSPYGWHIVKRLK